MTREEWDALTDDEKWEAYQELLLDEEEEEFTPHSFLKWEIQAASEWGRQKREEERKKAKG